MDKVLINRYEKEFADLRLKIDTFYIHKMGLLQKHTFLKVKDFFLYAVPTYLGFQEGQIILAMSERERDLLDSLKDKQQQLRMRFDSPLVGKETGLFLKAQIQNISEAGKTGFVLVDMTFNNVSDIYKHILIELFQLRIRLEREFDSQKRESVAIPVNLLAQLGIESSPRIILSGKGRYRCLFKSLGINHCELYVSSTLAPELENSEQSASIELEWKEGSILIPARRSGEAESTHQSGINLLAFDLDFSAALTDILLPVTELIKHQRSGRPEMSASGDSASAAAAEAQGDSSDESLGD